jgi:hypothetical protein
MSTLGDATDVKFGNFCKFQDTERFLFPVHAMFRHDCPLAIKPASTPRRLVHTKKTWRDSVLIYVFLSAVSVLVVAQRSSEVPEGLMNSPVFMQHLVLSMYAGDCPVHRLRKSSFLTGAQDSHLQRVTIPDAA